MTAALPLDPPTFARRRLGHISYLDSQPDDTTGRPLVLVHGIFDSAECWSGVLPGLGADRRVVSVDLRAHGESDLEHDDFRLQALAADIVSVIEHVLAEPVVLAGHSLGGLVAQQVAVTRPDLLHALVLEDPGWVATRTTADGVSTPPSVLERAEQLRTWTGEQILTKGRLDHPQWFDDEFPTWFRAKQQVDLEFLSARQDWKADTGISAVAAQTMPTLLITGEERLGAMVTAAEAKEVQELLGSLARHVQIRDAGHDIRKDQREPYIGVVNDFLRRIDM